MCLSAVYWAGIKTVYYATDRDDAEKIGFSDKFIYDELSLPNDKRSVKLIQVATPKAESLFEEWRIKEDKTEY